MSKNSVFRTGYVPICTIITMAFFNASHYVVVNVQKRSDNTVETHLSEPRVNRIPRLFEHFANPTESLFLKKLL